MKEFWVDVSTTGSFEHEQEEALYERTFGEGTASSLNLGLPPCEATSPRQDPGEDTDREADLDDDGNSTARVPSKNDVEKEFALEAGLMANNNKHFDRYTNLFASVWWYFFLHLRL